MIKIKHDISDLSQEEIEQGPTRTSSSSARDSYLQESLFQTNAYLSSTLTPVSFSESNHHYGKLNKDLMSLVPSRSRLATIDTQNDLQVLDFVADAYFAFQQEFQSFKFTNKFSPKSKIYNFAAKGKKETLDQKYDIFLQDQYSYFLDFVNTKKNQNEIKDLSSFITTFSYFIDSRTPFTPYTKSSFLVSNRVSRKVSGLVIDLDTGDINDDRNKVDNYISEEDFECYQDLCAAFGFVVNKDLPWQIVADLSSVNMKFYFHLKMNQLVQADQLERNPVPTSETKFEKCKDVLENFNLTNFIFDSNPEISYYEIVNYNDLINLKNLIYYFYNSFVEYQPRINTTEIVKEFNVSKIKQNSKNRRLAFLEDLETTEFDSMISRLYVYIKARENNAPWSQSKFESVVAKTRQVQKVIDSESAIRYVQRQVNEIAKSQTKQRKFHF